MSTADAEATTRRIRAEALRLFAQRGYGNTTIEHISSAANVGVATIYRRWADKGAIANDLYGEGVESMLTILDERCAEDPQAEFVAIWRRLWEWATANRDLLLFINASAGAPWLTAENVARKASMAAGELETYARLRIDAPPDFAAALVSGTMSSVLTNRPDIEPDEVAERLWRALTLRSE